MAKPMRGVLDRILARCEEDEAGCWIFQGFLNYGYGQVTVKEAGRWVTRPAHRVVYKEFHGDVLGDLHLDHLCRKRACLNPFHMDPVTPQVNTSRAAEARTMCKRGLHPLEGGRCRPCRNEYRRAYHHEKRWADG